MKRIVSGSARKRTTSSRSAPITVSRQGTCSARAPKALSRIGRPLRSSARPTKTTRSSSERRLRPARRPGDVDSVGDDLVAAAEPAPSGPGGGLGDRDPRREVVEHEPGAERARDVVGEGLGRVGVEGADGRRPGAERRVPADERDQRLVDVDDVVSAAAQLADRVDDAALRRTARVGDRAVGAGTPIVRPERASGSRGPHGLRAQRGAPGRLSRPGGSKGASTRTWWPRPRNSSASASTCRFTPP